jgi:trans-aconitate 2-methyltransferase
MHWDPQQYSRFAGERARPFADLLARVWPATAPRLVADLGCGPGTLTAGLAERWPGARVIGVDSSPDMIRKAATLAGDRLSFAGADLVNWTPPGPVDVLVTTATLQWVPDHLSLLPRLAGLLAPGGVLALQVPHNFGAPSHALLHQLRNSAPWSGLIGDGVAPGLARVAASAGAAGYLAVLVAAGCRVDAWETTYLHVLSGEDPVLEWMRGAGARPVLQALPDDERRAAFERQYAALLREAYPAQDFGTILPFQRVFAVATAARPAPSGAARPVGGSRPAR